MVFGPVPGVTIDTATRRRRDVTANPCAVNPGDRRESGLKMAGEALGCMSGWRRHSKKRDTAV